jgi:hypothetical protein
MWARGIRIHRDTATVVGDPATAIGEKGHLNGGAMACHGFIDGVVHDLPDEVMETLETRRADVHAWPLTNRVQTLKNLDVLRVVIGFAGSSGSLGWRCG